ncbi:MAG: tyrosine-type recombinase/integrase [Candidatus Thiodiazotropha endolucinida]
MAPLSKRTANHYPSHIDSDKLPANVGYDPRGKGRWYYRKSHGRNNRGTAFRFGSGKTTLAEIWQHVEAIETDTVGTFKGISLKFQESRDWSRLAKRTQDNYLKLHKSICATKTKTGTLLGDIALDAWTPGAVRRYLETRAKNSESVATAEIRYIKRVFSWAISMDYYLKANPAKEIKLTRLNPPRTHYVQDADYYLAIAVAPLIVGLAAHMAYLTGRRRTDILNLHRSQLTDDGIEFEENKTGKLTVVAWSDELRATVDMLKSEAGDSVFLFPRRGSPSEPMTDSAFDTAWQRVRTRVKAEDGTPCQFKDIRAKHASDLETDDEASLSLRHSGRSVTRRHYRRRPTKVVSLR